MTRALRAKPPAEGRRGADGTATSVARPSRQVRYQRRHRAAGLCTVCPRAAPSGNKCAVHRDLELQRARQENRQVGLRRAPYCCSECGGRDHNKRRCRTAPAMRRALAESWKCTVRSPEVNAGMILVAPVVISSIDPAAIARWAAVDEGFAHRVVARLRAQGVWLKDRTFAVDWLDFGLGENECSVALACDALVGLGACHRTADRRYFLAPAPGRVGAGTKKQRQRLTPR